MIYFLMLPVVLSVETVLVQTSLYKVLPGRQLSVNGSTSMTLSQPAVSALHCGWLCLADGDCVAANYEDAGVCRMSSVGNIRVKNSSHTTAILAAPFKAIPQVVGWWPLQEDYEGRDLSGNGNHIELHDVTYPDDGLTPWSSPAAYFTNGDYGHIKKGRHLDVSSFSWVAKVYPIGNNDTLVAWQYNNTFGVNIILENGQLLAHIVIPDCPQHDKQFGTVATKRVWHTMAVTYDFTTNTIVLWEDGVNETSTREPCGTAIETSPEVLIGTQVSGPNKWRFNGRLSCMVLYSTVENYDVLYNATRQQCRDN